MAPGVGILNCTATHDTGTQTRPSEETMRAHTERHRTASPAAAAGGLFDDVEMVTVAVAARRTGLGRSSLYAHMNSDALPFHKYGARRVLRGRDLNAFVAACRVGG
jgi:hypothetical protein